MVRTMSMWGWGLIKQRQGWPASPSVQRVVWEAAIFDPLREVQPYLDRAAQDNAKIKYVFDCTNKLNWAKNL